MMEDLPTEASPQRTTLIRFMAKGKFTLCDG
jgi:hypothetical protein